MKKINYVDDILTLLDYLYDDVNDLYDELRANINDSLLEYPQIRIDDLFFDMKKDNLYSEELEEYIRKYIIK